MRVSAFVLVLGIVGRSLHAQDDTLRVLRYTPSDSATPGNIITVTFDRPVAGRLDASVDPSRIVQITPALRGRLAWRDPITLRFVPDEPIAPGTSVTVRVDTTFRAIDGSALQRPFQFTFRVPGPRLLHWQPGNRGRLPFDGVIQLLYSAPVDLDALRRGVRLELSNCNGSTQEFSVRQRPLEKTDPYQFQYAGGWDRDTTGDRFRRVVELEPVRRLPEDCAGRLTLPTTADDAQYGKSEQFDVATIPSFRFLPSSCPERRCGVGNIVLRFSLPVKREQIIRHVRVDSIRSLELDGEATESDVWVVKRQLAPQSRYTIRLDSALRDVHGRAIAGNLRIELLTGDYDPVVRYAKGALTVPNDGPNTIGIRHVNVRTVSVVSLFLPDSLRARAISRVPRMLDDEIEKMAVRAETATVVLQGRFNEQRSTELPLPASLLRDKSGFVALRIEMVDRIRRADTSRSAGPDASRGMLAPMIVRARSRSFADISPWYAYLQRTGLAVHAKLGEERVNVLVTGLTDGRPRSGARVRKLDPEGRVLAEGTTDSAGVAQFMAPVDASKPRGPVADDYPWRFGAIEATLDGDRVVTALNLRALGYEPANPLEVHHLGASASAVPAAAAALFGDRDIYRPGEPVYIKGVVREGILGALTTPTSMPVRLKITSNWGEYAREPVVVHDTVLTTSEFGTVADSFRLPFAATLGAYHVTLGVGGPDEKSWRDVASMPIRVAEYRAPEFLVSTKADSVTRFADDTIRIETSARYLFGAPMRRAQAMWSAVRHEAEPWSLELPGSEGWTVGVWDWSDGSGSGAASRGGDLVLGDTGSIVLDVPLASMNVSRPGRVQVDVTVIDVNRQTVTSSVSVPVHAARLYVLTKKRSREWYWTAGSPQTLDVRAIRPDGQNVAGVPVAITVVKRIWNSSRGDWRDTVLRNDTVRTAAAPVSYTFVPRSGGQYAVRMSAVDERGAVTRTTLMAYALASGSVWRTESSFHLPLQAEQRELAVGEETRISFDSPFDQAEAWITVERETVLEHRRMLVRRGVNVVPLRVTSAHIPNVFVSVLLRNVGVDVAQRPDSANERLRVGYVDLRVNTSPKRLAVTVVPSQREYRPGDSVRVRVNVRDASGAGARSEVALWAVDEGVLALTGYAKPDVLSQIYQWRGVGLELWSTIPTLMTSDPGLVVTMAQAQAMYLSSVVVTGYDEISGASPGVTVSSNALVTDPMRRTFRTTAFFVGSARTNASGDADVRVRLPDNLTTYRVMAVAIGADDRFGSGDSSLVVTRPVVARPSLPRFVRAADTLYAGAVINVRDGSARAMTVDAESEGIVLQGEARRATTLAAGTGSEERWSLIVPPRDGAPDSVTLRIRASDGTQGDAVETRLPVRPDFHRRRHTRMGGLVDNAEVELPLPADIDPERSRLTLRVGTSPLAPMLSAYDWLRVYPFDCTEQIASGGRALIAVWKAMRYDTLTLGGDPRRRLQQLADELAKRQRPDGAIRYWGDHPWSSPWLTSYAGMFLLEARAEGIVVDSTVLRRVANFLAETIESPVDTGGMNRYERRERRLELGVRVAAVDFLRRFGSPDAQAEDDLLAVAHVMTWEDRLRIAEIVASSKGDERDDERAAARALLDQAWKLVTPAGNRVDLPQSAFGDREFPSRVSPAARLLTATLVMRPDHPLIGGLIETVLMTGRAERGWSWSTQDYASVVMALAALDGGEARPRSIRVSSGKRTLFTQQALETDSAQALPLTGLLARDKNGATVLRVRLSTKRGAKPAYYALSVDEVPSKPPVTPDIEGIVVERWYERFDDGTPVTSVKEGDIVRVRLRITVPADREFVAIEDPVPAGLEPVDLTLRTSSTLQPFVTPASLQAERQGDRDRDGPRWQSWLYGRWDDGWWSPWDHKALHDDRVVYFARMLWTGSYTASYIARATTVGSFVRPPAHAEEMYNPGLRGRSDGGRFGVEQKNP